jgi:phage-related minor tail protein
MDEETAAKIRKEIAHDRLKAYYYAGKVAVSQEEMKEAIKRVKEQMRNMTADDLEPASRYWQFVEEQA